LAALCAAWVCIGCAQGGPGASSDSGITMYGTIDQGITFRK
jgi:hypothetical protein